MNPPGIYAQLIIQIASYPTHIGCIICNDQPSNINCGPWHPNKLSPIGFTRGGAKSTPRNSVNKLGGKETFQVNIKYHPVSPVSGFSHED